MGFGKNALVKISRPVLLPFILLFFVSAFSDDYAEWTYNTTVDMNTTGTGLSGTVSTFPLLVRLNSSNFTFSEADNNGADIRFAKSDGTHLPYEIERWDAAGNLADIWVLVDQVLADDNTQFIRMYWGNDTCSDSSNSEAVFATSNNFA